MTREVIRLDLPASLKYLAVISCYLNEILRTLELSEEPDVIIYNVQLAVHEVCTNIIEHAYRNTADGRFELEIAFEPESNFLEVTLTDEGGHFDLEAVPMPSLDEPQERGYGLFLVHQLMDKVTYEPDGPRNYWRLEKQL